MIENDMEQPVEEADSDQSGENQEQEATSVLEDLDQLRADRDRFLGLLQRTRADFENYQKRVQRDLEQERRYALRPLAIDLLPALDNLERALDSGREDNPVLQGVRMVQEQITEVLKRHGVTRIEAAGQPFDPNLHQAVMQQPSPGRPPNTVLQVLEHGYNYHDRVLRPSKVIVSQNEPSEPEA